jgi:hypothetical protein
MSKRKLKWRVLAWKGNGEKVSLESDDSEFDELVVAPWLHIEQMGVREFWFGLNVGEDLVHIDVTLGKDRTVKSILIRDETPLSLKGKLIISNEHPGDKGDNQ